MTKEPLGVCDRCPDTLHERRKHWQGGHWCENWRPVEASAPVYAHPALRLGFGNGEYSCVSCVGMAEPCEHWKTFLASGVTNAGFEQEASAPASPPAAIVECPYCHEPAYAANGECGCWCHPGKVSSVHPVDPPQADAELRELRARLDALREFRCATQIKIREAMFKYLNSTIADLESRIAAREKELEERK